MSSVTYRLGLTDSLGITGLGMVAVAVTGIATIAVAIIGLGRYYGHVQCVNWSRQTGIRSKFVLLQPISTGTCLAQTPDGRWVLNSKWQAFVPAGAK